MFDGLRESWEQKGEKVPQLIRFPIPERWPDVLDEHEAQFEADEYGAAGRLLQRETAAGFAHIDRLAIDGGPLVEMPRRHRGTIRTFLVLLVIAALGAGILLVTR